MGTLIEAGGAITRCRVDYLSRLQGRVDNLVKRLGLDFRPVITLQKGWRETASLEECWRRGEDRDRSLGYTNAGPHRANLLVKVDDCLGLETLSSGQVKLAYLVLRLAQLDDFLDAKPGTSPIIFFDDLAAELDGRHLGAVLHLLADHKLQRFVTSPSSASDLPTQNAAVFHVERGALTPDVP
jgi:DNA replication and repair protein RecF